MEFTTNFSALKNSVFEMSVFFSMRYHLLDIPSRIRSIGTLVKSDIMSNDKREASAGIVKFKIFLVQK